MTWTLQRTAMQGGQYRGLLSCSGAEAPTPLEAVHNTSVLPGLNVSPVEGAAGQWMVTLDLPQDVIADTVQTIVFRKADTGETLDSVAVLTDASVDDNLRVEVDLLRAEVEMLKSALRRISRQMG